jgi:hypothetical protein
MVSMMDILPGAAPLMSGVRQTGSGPLVIPFGSVIGPLDSFGRWAEDALDRAVSEASDLDGRAR